MVMPEGNLVAPVERMARALEPLAAASSVRAVLEEVVRSAVSVLAADQGSVSWLEADGAQRTFATPGLPEEAATACAALLMGAPMGSQEYPQPRVVEELGTEELLKGEPTLPG